MSRVNLAVTTVEKNISDNKINIIFYSMLNPKNYSKCQFGQHFVVKIIYR